jgi:hypothetical protein
VPERLIILATTIHYPGKNLVELLKSEIVKAIPAEMIKAEKKLL